MGYDVVNLSEASYRSVPAIIMFHLASTLHDQVPQQPCLGIREPVSHPQLILTGCFWSYTIYVCTLPVAGKQ